MKKCLKVMTALALSFSLAVNMSCTVIADNEETASSGTAVVSTSEAASKEKNGWYKKDGDRYYFVNGKMVKNRTKKIDGKIYLFGRSGKLLTNGVYTINGDKYSVNEKGIVACNQWIRSNYYDNETVYYYGDAAGVITEYALEKDSTFSFLWRLYINGKKATDKDLSFADDGKISFGYFFKMNNDIYYISGGDLSVAAESGGKANEYMTMSEGQKMYDMGSHKLIGEFYGNPYTDKRARIKSGSLLFSTDGYVYKVDSTSGLTKTQAAGSFVITDSSFKKNSVGGIEPKISFCNNSSKSIKYITYTVYFLNSVGDSVSCRITNDTYSYLQATGPYTAHSGHTGWWDPVIYSYSAEKMIISSVKVDYMDGTSVTLSGNKLTQLV